MKNGRCFGIKGNFLFFLTKYFYAQFNNFRYKELQGEGKDASNYDFKPEWILFWNKRMVELHNIEVKTKKDALRRRYIPSECERAGDGYKAKERLGGFGFLFVSSLSYAYSILTTATAFLS